MIEYGFYNEWNVGDGATVDFRYRYSGSDVDEFEGIDEQLMAQFLGLI